MILTAWVCLLMTSGCSVERHNLKGMPCNRVVRVESGDRLFFDMSEPAARGARWSATCSDSDVDVTLRHVKDRVQVEIRIHRGYDGPSSIDFAYSERGEARPAHGFSVTLFKRTGDVAFWE